MQLSFCPLRTGIFFQPTALDHFLCHLTDRANFNAGEGGTKQWSEMPPVACEEDIGMRADCCDQNGLVFGGQGGFRVGSDARGNLQDVAQGLKTLDPVRFFQGKISCGFLNDAWVRNQNRMRMKVLQ